MNAMPPKYHIGQEFYFVPNSRSRSPVPLAVSKIGRKWIYLGQHRGADQIRADTETLVVDAEYGYGGTLYGSKQERLNEMNRNAARLALSRGLYCLVIPRNLSEAEIRQAAAILRIELPQPIDE